MNTILVIVFMMFSTVPGDPPKVQVMKVIDGTSMEQCVRVGLIHANKLAQLPNVADVEYVCEYFVEKRPL